MKRAFTLIEMLVVISVISILSSMITVLYDDNVHDALSRSSLELKTVLEKARGLAIKTGRMHAVTFQVENAGDGRVMKNASHVDGGQSPKRHWYAIIGPDFTSGAVYGGYRRSTHKIPVAEERYSYQELSFYCLVDYIDAMKASQIGPKHYLHPGVRFLALGDVDNIYPGYKDATYPRPWFGYFDDTTQTLHPWGAYEETRDAGFARPNTGLDYQGEDGSLSYDSEYDTIINPSQVWGRIHIGATANDASELSRDFKASKFYRGVQSNFIGPDTTVLASKDDKKVPRPLLNAYWGDFMIIFDAEGSASFVYGEIRSIHFKTFRGPKNAGRNDMLVENKVQHTGGVAITLCRDVDEHDEIYTQKNSVTGGPDFNTFASAEDALASITPFTRVFVWRANGSVEIRDMYHPANTLSAEDLKQKNPYPHGYGD